MSYFGNGPFGGFEKLGFSNCTAVDQVKYEDKVVNEMVSTLSSRKKNSISSNG